MQAVGCDSVQTSSQQVNDKQKCARSNRILCEVDRSRALQKCEATGPAGRSSSVIAAQTPATSLQTNMEEKLVKQKKKHKKEKVKRCAVDEDGSLEVKQETKTETADGQLMDSGEKKEKKKKSKNVNESLNEPENENDIEVTKKKKKKKKKKLVDEPTQSVKEEENVEKKVKNNSVQMKPEDTKTEEEEETQPKKTKKEKNSILVVSCTEDTEEPVKEKKKKKKKTTEALHEIPEKKNKARVRMSENGETPEEDKGEAEEVKERKKKKNKKKEITENGDEAVTPQINGSKEEEDCAPKKKTDRSAKTETVPEEEEKSELKKKAKKEKGKKVHVEVSEEEETEPKKKKRKKGKSGAEEKELSSLKSEETLNSTSKKRKKGTVETPEEGVSVETKKKKKRIREEDQHESPRADLNFLSEKSGNADEVTVNQGLGQWSTAQFNSSEQQQKFLRLMGGFKKGFQPAAGSSGGANMALGKEAQQQLQQGLLGEFERAHLRRMDFNNRGAGLGFSAPSNKKFSIDIAACRSVRFDD